MVFSSIFFILYFLPIFLFTYYAVSKKYKNIVILLFSIFFYSWGAPKFIFVILLTTFIDFYLVKKMYQSVSLHKKRSYLILSIIINVGLLCYFKYSNFFIENLNDVLSGFGMQQHIPWVKVLLPIGISFYTFETITYVVDVYRGVHKPLDNVWDYQVYIMLFPKLIAGPIVRFHDIADQIEPVRRTELNSVDDKLIGFYRFAIGLAKKVLIANQLGLHADSVMTSDFSLLSTATAWTGILAYTFQIYFDFSGYSDMAIGICRMIGFTIPENFNNPYTATSITDFWRKWHISVSSWMRNYLYIPLGGNRVASKSRLYFNLWLVFLISGLWHGAAWSFVFWGAYHGFFLILERVFLLSVYEKIGRMLSTIITFLIVMIGWVFFRIEHVEKAFVYIKKMFIWNTLQSIPLDDKTIWVFAIAIVFSFFTSFSIGQKIQDGIYVNSYSLKMHLAIAIMSICLVMISVGTISAFGFNPFIYFRF